MPNTAEYFLQSYHNFYEQHDYDAALAAIDRAIEIDRTESIFFQNRGAVLIDLGRHQDAFDALDHALRLDPEDADILNLKTIIYLELKEFEKAKAIAEKTIIDFPDNDDAHVNLGVCYEDEKNFDAALACYEKALKLNPENGYTYLNIGDIFANRGDYLNARRYLRNARDLACLDQDEDLLEFSEEGLETLDEIIAITAQQNAAKPESP